MKKLTKLFLLVVVCVSAATVDAAPRGASVKVINQSSWDIYSLYLSPTDNEEWGPDQLGEQAIASGTTFTLHSIRCGNYDIKIVDEDGDECIVADVDLCNDRSMWKITNKDLLACQSESEN